MELLKTILGKMSITKTQKMIGDFSSFLLEIIPLTINPLSKTYENQYILLPLVNMLS